MLSFFPKRAVHLDFHTSPDIADVGRDFDPDDFAQTFVDAHVDSVTVFAKCHHGHLYYGTGRAERHPGLRKDIDLLRAQVEALHARNIKAPIYLSVQVDDYAGVQHPDWCVLDERGQIFKMGGPLGAGWRIVDMSSPYQDYFAEQLAEVLDLFAPTDGIFLDMCWDQPSCSPWAMAAMKKGGYDPLSEADRMAYAREVSESYMKRFKKMVDAAHPGREVGIWFNSRPKTNLDYEKKYLRHVEIECLPTGGWGYAYFPYVSRFVRPLALPTLGMTGRFHKSWGDFGGVKPEAALMYECCCNISQGLSSSVGDQLHPRGTVERAAYEILGNVYRHVEACEPWMEGAKLQSEVAVLIDPKRGDEASTDCLGAVRALQEMRYQFDLVPFNSPLGGYPLVIVPDSIPITPGLSARLQDYVKKGGRLVISGGALADGDGKLATPWLSIKVKGKSEYAVTFVRPAKCLASALPVSDFVMYERGWLLKSGKGSETLARVVDPYFDRDYRHFCSHGHTPPADVSEYAAAVQCGNVVALAAPVFQAYGQHGLLACRQLIGACIARLLTDKLIVDSGPSHMEATVARVGKRTVVNLLSFIPARRTVSGLDVIEDPFPLVDVKLSVRLPRKPKRALLAPAGSEIAFEWDGKRASASVTCLTGHAMVVFD